MPMTDELMNRARQEYLEMPGLLLTTEQASRLWQLDAALCQELLGALVREKFLFQTDRGAFLLRGTSAA